MKIRIISTLLIVSIAACSSAQQTTSATINYFYGEVKTTSVDGKIPYGPVKHSLVKRIVDKQNKTITEFVNQDGKDFSTKLSQLENSSVFSAEDLSTKSFTGKITFT